MEFWGAEVKAGMPLKVRPQVDHLIHISQATIDGAKKGECGLLYVTVDWIKYVIGTLSQDHIPHISFNLVLEQEFELSHSLSQGSVHFVGYKSPNIDQEDYYPSEEEEVEVPATSTVTSAGNPSNGAAAAASNVVKADDEDDEDESDEDEEEEEEESEDVDGSKKVMEVDEDDSEDEEEDDSEDDEEEEETPKQPEPSNKKRATASASKTPVPAKKTKTAVAATPHKTEEKKKKKGGHPDTPHPAKKGPNQSPKSGAQSSGGNKQFNSGKQFGSNNKGKGKGKGRA